MKKILLYAAVLVAMVACSEAAFDDSVLGVENRKITVSVSAENKADTRVSYDEDWVTSWDREDELLAIDGSGNTAKFTMDSYDATEPSFSGAASSSDYNLIYPYSLVDVMDFTNFNLDLTTQDTGAKYTYMISENMIDKDDTAPTVNMMHVGATMVLDMQFKGYNDYTIESLEVNGLNSKGVLNAEYEFNEEYPLTNLTANTITITGEDIKIKSSNNGIVNLRFNILPTTIATNGTIRVNAYLKSSSGTMVSLTKTITNDTGKAIEFGRAKYHTLKCGFSKSNVISYEDLWTKYAAENFEKGNGLKDSPYEITTAEQLARVALHISDYQSSYFKLADDIDLTGHEWVAIGNGSSIFQGTFDGDGHKITGLYIDEPTGYNQALFGCIDGATIKNLSVAGSVKGCDKVAGVVGYAIGSSITNCYNNCYVVATGDFSYVGGVVGGAGNSSIANCYNSGSVVSSSDVHVGGVAGYVVGSSIINCYNIGSVKSGNNSNVGGVVGDVLVGSSVVNSYNRGSVTSGKEANFGGIAGCAGGNSNVNNCCNSGSMVYGDSSHAGAIIGDAYSSGVDVTYCYWIESESMTSIGNNDGATLTNVTKMDTDEMKGEVIIDVLNNYSNNYNKTSPAIEACMWITGADGFPTLDY